MTQPRVIIWTDGACSPNPGPGGWGAVIKFGTDEYCELSGGESDTTNNRMELEAAVQALAYLDTPYRVTLYTDSRYLKDGVTLWMKRWQNRGWKTVSGSPVKNRDLWQQLNTLNARHKVQWQW